MHFSKFKPGTIGNIVGTSGVKFLWNSGMTRTYGNNILNKLLLVNTIKIKQQDNRKLINSTSKKKTRIIMEENQRMCEVLSRRNKTKYVKE
jgi:hypothetical protein